MLSISYVSCKNCLRRSFCPNAKKVKENAQILLKDLKQTELNGVFSVFMDCCDFQVDYKTLREEVN